MQDRLDKVIKNSQFVKNYSRKCQTQLRGEVIGNYQIEQVIGLGGFAKVSRAVHLPTAQQVAVKVISFLKLTQFQRQSVTREINIHKNVCHQNIVQIYEVHEENDRMYIFMEYCEMGEIFDFVNQNGPLSLRKAKQLFWQICSAVSYLHSNSIAHRDIKAENILLDRKGNAKLVDFGLANYFDQTLLKTFCGSPSYIAPEVLSKNEYNPKLADVWCLGVLLYVMVKAQLPFYHQNPKKQKQNIKLMKFQSVKEQSVDHLLSRIFTPPQQRITLEEIEEIKFVKGQKFSKANSLSFEAQRHAIDEEVIEKVVKDYKVDFIEVKESVREKKLNHLQGLYCLRMEKQRKLGFQSYYDVKSSKFMQNNGLKKLRKTEKQSLTPLLKRKSACPTVESTPKSLRKGRDQLRTIQGIFGERKSKEMRLSQLVSIKGFQQSNKNIKIQRRNSQQSPESPQRRKLKKMDQQVNNKLI